MGPDDLVYLKKNVIAEPIIMGWYAWPQLIPPASLAMNVVGRHLKIMDSYIQSPQLHAEAVRNPKMKGGPFVDYPEDRAEGVRRLRDLTLQEQERLFEFAGAIRQLYEILRQESSGYGLDPLYGKVLAPLKGYVELSYDLLNQPSCRFYEPLLYRGPYYDPGWQGLSIYESGGDERPFALSTPRLPDDRLVHVRLPFRSESIDKLARMRRVAGSYSAIRVDLPARPRRRGRRGRPVPWHGVQRRAPVVALRPTPARADRPGQGQVQETRGMRFRSREPGGRALPSAPGLRLCDGARALGQPHHGDESGRGVETDPGIESPGGGLPGEGNHRGASEREERDLRGPDRSTRW